MIRSTRLSSLKRTLTLESQARNTRKGLGTVSESYSVSDEFPTKIEWTEGNFLGTRLVCMAEVTHLANNCPNKLVMVRLVIVYAVKGPRPSAFIFAEDSKVIHTLLSFHDVFQLSRLTPNICDMQSSGRAIFDYFSWIFFSFHTTKEQDA